MKLTTLLSRAAPFGVIAFLASLTFDVHPFPLFIGAAGLLFALIAVTDYTPRRRHATAAYSSSPLRRSEAMPLAA